MINSPAFIHPLASVDSKRIGAGTRIWQFTVILQGAIVGDNCNICAFVFVENDVVIGNDVTVKSGVQLWDGLRIDNNVFIGPNVSFANDKYPRSKVFSAKKLVTQIGEGSSVGAGAVILPGVKVGRMVMIGAGAVVTKDVPDKAIVYGNPAKINGFT